MSSEISPNSTVAASLPTNVNIDNRSALLRKRQEQEVMLINTILAELFGEFVEDAGIQKVKQALQEAMTTMSTLPETKHEIKATFGRFIKYYLLKNSALVKQTPNIGAWNARLNNKPLEYLQFKRDIKQALTDYITLDDLDIVIENILNALAINPRINVNINADELHKAVRVVLTADPRLRNIGLDDKDLLAVIAKELEFSAAEAHHINKNDKPKIYQLRVKFAVNKYLYQHKLLNDDEKLAYEIAEKLATKLASESPVPLRDKKNRHCLLSSCTMLAKLSIT